jgi:hypothetical protein
MRKAMRRIGQGFLSLLRFVLLLGQPTIGDAQEEEPRVAGGKDLFLVIRFIDGERPVPAHGPRHMPVWGEVFRGERTDSEAKMRILSLTAFLESIQEK